MRTRGIALVIGLAAGSASCSAARSLREVGSPARTSIASTPASSSASAVTTAPPHAATSPFVVAVETPLMLRLVKLGPLVLAVPNSWARATVYRVDDAGVTDDSARFRKLPVRDRRPDDDDPFFAFGQIDGAYPD